MKKPITSEGFETFLTRHSVSRIVRKAVLWSAATEFVEALGQTVAACNRSTVRGWQAPGRNTGDKYKKANGDDVDGASAITSSRKYAATTARSLKMQVRQVQPWKRNLLHEFYLIIWVGLIAVAV